MKTLDLQQGSPEWFAARLGIPTATDFEDIVTAVKGDLSASAEGLINRLIDQAIRPGMQEESFTGNRHTERGHELEPQARDWYSFVTGETVFCTGFVLRDDNKAGCSPDGLIGETYKHPSGSVMGYWRRGLEIKCPDGPTHVGYLRAGTLPSKYRQQVHGSMAITGLRAWDFVSFCPGYEPLLVRVEWDGYTDKCAKALDDFLDRLDAARACFGGSHESNV